MADIPAHNAAHRGPIRPSVRPELGAVVPGTHGGTDVIASEAASWPEERMLDFSASVSPFGPVPAVTDALAALKLEAYPDPVCVDLRRSLSRYLGLSPEMILATAGSTESIRSIAHTYMGPEVRTLALAPAFSEYEPAAGVMGSRFESFALTPPDSAQQGATSVPRSFSLDGGGFVEWVAERLPAVLFLNDPHNPTGVRLGTGLLSRLLAIDGPLLVVVDEAYRDFLAAPDDLTPQLSTGRLILMRSLTKAQGLAGLRLGYLLSSPQILHEIRRAMPPWTVSSPAQAAGIATLADSELPEGGHIAAAMSALRSAKAGLTQGLRDLGYEVIDSDTCFFLVDLGAGADADELRDRLLRMGVRVRSCASFGLPRHVRISVRREEENQRLLLALRELESGAGPS